MNFLKHILLDKKYYESIDEVESFLDDNGLSEDTVIQSFIFDKGIFPSEEDARLWIREHGFVVESVEDTLGGWVINQLDESEFVSDSFKEVGLRTGVSAIVGVLKVDAVTNGLAANFLSLRNSEDIKLSDKLPHIIELAKVVKGIHVAYGEVEITESDLRSFERNFNDGIVGVDLMIDYDHEQSKAAGWIKSVFVSMDGQTLLGEVKWTPKGAKTLSDRDFRYFSPEFTRNYVHPHTGVAHGPTLLGGGLVNRPFLKMDAIVTFKETNINTKEEVVMDKILLSEHNEVKATLEKTISDLKLSEEKAKTIIASMKSENVALAEEVKALKEEKLEAKRLADNEKLFTEGRINKAQLVALNEGKDPYEVFSLGEVMNTKPAGVVADDSGIVLSEGEKRACDLFGLTPEEMKKHGN